jgi:NADH-quinone oxidoreductase subunit N
MLLGGLMGLVQSDLRRLLAFSSISHSGYLLAAVIVRPPDGTIGVLYYLVAYSLMNVGAFGVLAALSPVAEERDLSTLVDLTGLARRHLPAATAMSVFLLSLAGFPPTAGFLAKWFVFRAAIGDAHMLLALMIVLTSVLAALYYLRPILYMFTLESTEAPAHISVRSASVLGFAAVIVALGVLVSGPVLRVAETAAELAPVALVGPSP